MARKRRTPDSSPSPGEAAASALRTGGGGKTAEAGKDGGKKQGDGAREVVESIVVAFILAFLFRTFEAEAFVIPTGSMAPTLYGRHKDVECPECGVHYTIGASDELQSGESGYLVARVQTGYCPNCRFPAPARELPVFTGDRILVNKWPYEFGEPDRWDVVVFKWPGGPRTNYIKRLVGLPGEEVRVEGGDVFVRGPESDEWRIPWKDPTKQRELQIPVYDDDHPPRALLEAGWPERWEGLRRDGDEGWIVDEEGWRADREDRAYSVDLPEGRRAWLMYRHFVPDPVDWELLPELPPGAAEPQLVTDYLAYNAYRIHSPYPAVNARLEHSEPTERDAFWVGDLTLNGEVVVDRAEGELLLELNEGRRRYRCAIDLETGQALLYYLEEGLKRNAPVRINVATGETPFGSPGRYAFSFANVDQRLLLWVRNSLVEFDQPTTCSEQNLVQPVGRDLAPVGIAATGTRLEVRHLLLERDVYYRAEEHRFPSRGRALADSLARHRGDPEAWSEVYGIPAPSVTFDPLGPDEFFMLGDNSARSQDSRLWDNLSPYGNRHAVPRSALVGKAFYVYWPHGEPFLNDGKGYAPGEPPILKRFFYHHDGPGEISDYPAFTVPFYPQYDRMTRIR